MMTFPLEWLQLALRPAVDQPQQQVDLSPVVAELQKMSALMAVVARQPRQVTA